MEQPTTDCRDCLWYCINHNDKDFCKINNIELKKLTLCEKFIIDRYFGDYTRGLTETLLDLYHIILNETKKHE